MTLQVFQLVATLENWSRSWMICSLGLTGWLRRLAACGSSFWGTATTAWLASQSPDQITVTRIIRNFRINIQLHIFWSIWVVLNVIFDISWSKPGKLKIKLNWTDLTDEFSHKIMNIFLDEKLTGSLLLHDGQSKISNEKSLCWSFELYFERYWQEIFPHQESIQYWPSSCSWSSDFQSIELIE